MNLSLFPHEWFYHRLGYRCGVVFVPVTIIDAEVARPGTSLAHANFPELPFFRELVARCPSLRWDGQVDRVIPGFIFNRLLREAIKFSHGGRRKYFPFYPKLTPEEQKALPQTGPFPLVGIQTHLAGMKTKRWGAVSWQKFIGLLLQAVPGIRLVLIDNSPEIETLAFSPQISTTVRFNIAQSIRLVQGLDLLVSVDSWSKYIAAAAGVPQVLVVPDQRAEYPGTTPEWVARRVLSGLTRDPRITVIGFEENPPRLTLPRLADLQPEELLRPVLDRLRAL